MITIDIITLIAILSISVLIGVAIGLTMNEIQIWLNHQKANAIADAKKENPQPTSRAKVLCGY